MSVFSESRPTDTAPKVPRLPGENSPPNGRYRAARLRSAESNSDDCEQQHSDRCEPSHTNKTNRALPRVPARAPAATLGEVLEVHDLEL